jgi:N6-adenosine-specific RNA methylase IME4
MTALPCAAPMLFDGPALRADWPFGACPPGSYDVIMADPPWLFALRSTKGEAKSAQAQYDCMSLDAIAELPVGELARPDCCLLYTSDAADEEL